MVDWKGGRQRTISRNRIRHVLREPGVDGSLFEGEQRTYVSEDAEGFQTECEQTVMLAVGCGHLIGFHGAAQELVGSCMMPGCGAPLCHRCAEAYRCARCLRVCCQKHLRLLQDTGWFCVPCKRIMLIKHYSLGIADRINHYLGKEF